MSDTEREAAIRHAFPFDDKREASIRASHERSRRKLRQGEVIGYNADIGYLLDQLDAARRERDEAREERDRVLSGDWTADELRKFVWCGGELTSARKVIEAARAVSQRTTPDNFDALDAALASHDAAYPPQEPSE